MIIEFYVKNDFSKNQIPQQVTVRYSDGKADLVIKNQNCYWENYSTDNVKTFGEIVQWVKNCYYKTENGVFTGLISIDTYARNKSDRYENRGGLILKEKDNELQLTYCPFKMPVVQKTLPLNSNWEDWAKALKDTDKVWEEIEEMAKSEVQKQAKDTTSLENIVFHHRKLWLENDYKISEMEKQPAKYAKAIASLQEEQKEIEAEVNRLDKEIRLKEIRLSGSKPTTPPKLTCI